MDYTLRYLPIAKQDLADAINFILNEYQNPIAAENTLDKIEQAIMQRLEDGPESFAIWQSAKKREYPYRRINVGNYTVWYVVIDNVMEIRRIQPARRNEELFLQQIMLELLIEEAKSRKVTEISLDATKKGRPLYESMGFSYNDSAMAMKL